MSGASPALEVLEPGLLASVQDGGRPGLAALGITRGGAADPDALAIANLLLGNDPCAAALELTLAGAAVRARDPLTLALAGADLGARIRETGRAVAPGSTIRLGAGETLAFEGGARPVTGRRSGCRAYVALPGGIDVPVVLGGRGTALGAGFGGIEGRGLRAGDVLGTPARSGAGTHDPAPIRSDLRWPGPMPSLDDAPLRLLPGPHAGSLGPGALEALATKRWTIDPASDRIGVRLAGEPLPGAGAIELASHGVLAGTVQVPPDGRPIVLLVDHQPTGGYPVVAVVIAADRAAIGQLAPGDIVTFEIVDEATARAAGASRSAARAAALAALHEAATWDALWHGAGG